MKNKKGISLIVLIITIIVVIILAVVVILTLSKNNPIESAKEARFKEDVRTFQDELALAVSKEYANAGGQRDEKITTSDFDEIKEYIPSFSEKYRDKFVIQDDELRYTNQIDEKEKEYAQNLNVREKVKLLPEEYQQVEYIESTGTQFIDTKVIGGERAAYEICFNPKGTINIGYEQYFAGHKSSPVPKLFSESGITGEIIGSHGVEKIIICKNKNMKYNIKYDFNGSIYCNSIEIGRYLDFGNGWGSLSWYIFNSHGEENLKSTMQLYSLKMFSNSMLIRNFIPCCSITAVVNAEGNIVPANTKGLYDLVEGKFYTNQGDPSKGDFIPGPDVD